MNFILMLIFTIVLGIFRVIVIKTGNGLYQNGSFYMVDGVLYYIHIMIYYAIYLNLGLGLFNLLPIPPLDGSKIFRAILKGKAKQFLYDIERYSMILIMILFFVMSRYNLLAPIVSLISDNVIDPIVDAISKIA